MSRLSPSTAVTGPNRLLTASKRTRGLVPGTVRDATACRIELPPHQDSHHPFDGGRRANDQWGISSNQTSRPGEKRSRVANSGGVRNAQGAARSGSNDLLGSVAVSWRTG